MEFVDGLPKSATGKILKTELRKVETQRGPQGIGSKGGGA